MATQLIKTKDGILIEVERTGGASAVSGKFVKSIDKEIKNMLFPILKSAIKPIQSAWQELNKDMTVEKAEIEFGIGFEVEGNVYIAKAKSNANLTVKLILTPPLPKGKTK